MKHKKKNDYIQILEEFNYVFVEGEFTSKINYCLIIHVLCSVFFVGFFILEVTKSVEEALMEEKKKMRIKFSFINVKHQIFLKEFYTFL